MIVNIMNTTIGGIGMSSLKPLIFIEKIPTINTTKPIAKPLKRVVACSYGKSRQQNEIIPIAKVNSPVMILKAAAGFTAS